MQRLFIIRNWKLALLAFLFIILFTMLGFWQLNRAHDKELLTQIYAQRTQHKPLQARQLDRKQDQRFYLTQLRGKFDNKHILLLDNKTRQKRIGYEVYIPFRAKGLAQPILVDLGFIPMGTRRDILPKFPAILGVTTITGMLNVPPSYVALGQMREGKNTLPLLVEYINLEELSSLLNYSLYPYVLMIDPHNPHAFAMEWQITTMAAEKHRGYAIQWFAFALTLLILFLVLK